MLVVVSPKTQLDRGLHDDTKVYLNGSELAWEITLFITPARSGQWIGYGDPALEPEGGETQIGREPRDEWDDSGDEGFRDWSHSSPAYSPTDPPSPWPCSSSVEEIGDLDCGGAMPIVALELVD